LGEKCAKMCKIVIIEIVSHLSIRYNDTECEVDKVIPCMVTRCRQCNEDSHFFFVHFKKWTVKTPFTPEDEDPPHGWLIIEAENIVGDIHKNLNGNKKYC
jgi:hypothetical protein